MKIIFWIQHPKKIYQKISHAAEFCCCCCWVVLFFFVGFFEGGANLGLKENMKSVDKNSETSLLVLLGHNPILLCIKNSQKTKPVKKKRINSSNLVHYGSL